jgi:hypothetical protein
MGEKPALISANAEQDTGAGANTGAARIRLCNGAAPGTMHGAGHSGWRWMASSTLPGASSSADPGAPRVEDSIVPSVFHEPVRVSLGENLSQMLVLSPSKMAKIGLGHADAANPLQRFKRASK